MFYKSFIALQMPFQYQATRKKQKKVSILSINFSKSHIKKFFQNNPGSQLGSIFLQLLLFLYESQKKANWAEHIFFNTLM